MKGRLSDRLSLVLVAACAICLWTVGVALGASTWVDEITSSLTFYKASYPTANWDPYQQKLAIVREALVRGDGKIVKAEMNQFLKMLRNRDHGINDVAADELYNFSLSVALTVRSIEENTAAEIEDTVKQYGGERLMSVPQNVIVTPDEGRPPCKLGGCDYWLDEVFDPGSG